VIDRDFNFIVFIILQYETIVSPSGERLRLFVGDDEWSIASSFDSHLLTAPRKNQGNPDLGVDTSGRNPG
jgi:hypothetical protein